MFLYESNHFGEEDFFQMHPLDVNYWPTHLHRSYEIIVVHKGTLHITIDQKEYQMGYGDLAFICPNQLHMLQTANARDVHIILFAPEMIGDFSTKYKNYYPENPIFQYPLNNLYEIQMNNIYAKKAFLYNICSRLVDSTAFRPYSEASSHNDILLKILQYVDCNYQDKCSLQSLSSSLGYDYTYLSRAFKHKLGITYTEYVNQYRIRQACTLLNQPQYDIGDIAMECGYDTIQSFNRNFKRILHLSPTRYRDNIQYSITKED